MREALILLVEKLFDAIIATENFTPDIAGHPRLQESFAQLAIFLRIAFRIIIAFKMQRSEPFFKVVFYLPAGKV